MCKHYSTMCKYMQSEIVQIATLYYSIMCKYMQCKIVQNGKMYKSQSRGNSNPTHLIMYALFVMSLPL